MPARPPSETIPTSGSSSRSSATRCSADRPCRPNASRSPRTSRTCLSARHPAERGPARREQPQPGVAGQPRRGRQLDPLVRVQPADLVLADLQLDHPGPAGVDRELRPVLVRDDPDRRGLHPQRHVLADQHHVPAVGGEVAGDRQDARVVVLAAEARRQHRQVGVVQLDVQRAAVLAERDGSVEPTVLDAQVVEHAERLPGEPAELRVVPLALQFADDHERQDDVVLTEPGRCTRVGEQHARVEDVRPAGFGRAAVGHRPSLGAAHQRPISKVRLAAPSGAWCRPPLS